jgi:hypothetical protein
MQKITPFLWFDNQAEESSEFLFLRVQEFEGQRDDSLHGGGTFGREGLGGLRRASNGVIRL